MRQMKYTDGHQCQTVVADGAAIFQHVAADAASADVGGVDAAHVGVPAPVLTSPFKSSPDLSEQLGAVGGVGLHPGGVTAVHLLNVLSPKGVQVELVP